MIKCTFTPKSFEEKVLEKALSIFEDETLSDLDKRQKLYSAFKDVAEQMGLTGQAKIEQALNIIKESVMSFFDEAQQLDDNDIRAALSEWKYTPEPEDTTADHLLKDNEKIERVNEDPFESYYQLATNAKIRAKQQANKIGVRSILYNENGIVNSVTELNESIRERQEELLSNVIEYLRSRVSEENQLKHPEIFGADVKLYKNGLYSGIVENITDLYGSILGKENFDPRIINKYYNEKNYKILDAYSSWIILNNFDTIMESIFGKAISINPDMAKFTGRNKYRIAGGSNVYNTWRTSDEIDMGKEINNVTQAIVTSIPFIPKGATTPSQDNIKFNEFLYIISKIKGLVQSANNDWTMKFGIKSKLPQELKQKYTGKSFLDLISTIRTNPQESLPEIFTLLNDNNVINSLISAGVIESNTFLNVDLNLINSVYEGLFNINNPNSLIAVQDKSGYNKTNYLAFISQTIDSAFKSSYLQYFRNPQGEIFIRNMYDQSINNIEYAIRDTINSINSKMMQQNYDDFRKKYDVKTEGRQFVEGNTYSVYFGRKTYTLTVNNSQIIGQTEDGKVVSEQLLEKLIDTFKETPDKVTFTIKDFHRGPLKVTVSLNKNEVNYEVLGNPVQSFTKEDYESLSDVIQEVLRQNLNIDNAYFDAYKNKFKFGAEGAIATSLMSVVSRVIANKHISNTMLNDLTPNGVNAKLHQIFGRNKSTIKPTFNKQLGEINLLTDSSTRILLDLAEAKAQATGRLTSSQVIDSNGNAVASSSLSRLLSSYSYQINEQVKVDGAAAKDFSLWNTGVFKGVQQMKEIQDNSNDASKSSTEFSNAEMEFATVFVDFLQSLLDTPINGKTTLQKGLTSFIPSENSDKTYIGRMLIDLSKLKVGDESVYDILRKDPRRIEEVIPVLGKELQTFYQKALDNINSTWTRVGLLLGESISYGNWKGHTLNEINEVVTKYNNENPTNPIVLIDQVHYVAADKKGNLMANESFLENIKRFSNPTALYDFLNEQNVEIVKQLLKDKLRVPITPEIQAKISEWQTSDWKEASKWIDQRTGEIIFAKVYDYNLESGENEFVANIRRPNDIGLLESLNDSVSAIEINPILESYNILNYFFTQEYMGSTVGMFYAHPNKKAKNIQQLLQTGQISTEEAHQLALADEKARKAAQDKRNVSFTAAMHSFLKGLLQGVPDEINIAIMDDPKDYFTTVSGDNFDIKPFDGCTFENPFFGEMENASLGGARVGVNKKTFTHYYDSRTGTGGIIKTANFSLTNDRIRGSKFYQRMMQNMTDRPWKNQNGTDFIIPPGEGNTLVNYNGEQIELINPNDLRGELYFRENGKFFKIASIEYLGNNTFLRYIQEVDRQGLVLSDVVADPAGPQLVNSNYKLWKLLGGENAMEISEGNSSLQFTENSIKIVANIINNIGTDPNDKTGKTLPQNIVRTQADIFQPLKHSDIHIMPTVGAVKQGAGNINTVDKYNIADPNQINFMKVKMNQAGIQLDKEHHADNEDLSIMTQVISACAARGYTQAQQQQMLNALASLARAGMKDYVKAFDEFFKAPDGNITDKKGNEIPTSQNYQQVILNTLVDALIHSSNSAATLQVITQELLNKAKEGKEIAFKDANVPYSDPSLFRKLHSTIAVALTRGSIKIKVQGVLSVLCPSFNIVKIYNGKTLASYNSDAEIQAEQEAFDANPENNLVNDIGRLKLGRTYKLDKGGGIVELRTIVTQQDYYNLKAQIANGEIFSVIEQFAPTEGFEGGRELGSYNATFQAILGVSQSPLQPTDEIRQQIDSVRGWQQKLEKAEELGLNIDKNIEPRSVYEYVTQNFPVLSRASVMKNLGLKPADLTKFSSILRVNGISIEQASEQLYHGLPETLQATTTDVDIKNIIEELLQTSTGPTDITRAIYKSRIEEALQEYDTQYQQEQAALNQTPKTYNINDLDSVHRLSNLKRAKELGQPITEEAIDQALKDVQKDLMVLHNKKGTVILDDGSEIHINPKSVNIEPYEIVMPKIFASIFGLETGDDLNVIKQDREFFVKRLLESIQPKVSSQYYSIGLMNLGSRSSMYILDRNQAIPNDPSVFVQKEISKIKEKDKTWRTNKKGEKMYQMQEGDTVYEYRHPDGTSYEVVVTSNPSFYLKNSFTTLNCSKSYNKSLFIEALARNKKNKAVAEYLDAIATLQSNYSDTLDAAIDNIQNVTLNDLKESPVGSYFINLGHKIHTSFLKSLEVVAARIPAQSMQSFMPMKVVAFEAPDINTAYVSTAQFLFQGSDLDIDAVSLASYSFDSGGKYILHTPYGNMETIENLEASMEIPFPTGEKLEINPERTFDYSRFISAAEAEGMPAPFVVIRGSDKLKLKLTNPYSIRNFAKLIEYFNKLGYIPAAQDESLAPIVEKIKNVVNRHNDYVNDEKAEEFSKNYVVSSMYKIGLSPANLIESQQAMDSITGPLKSVANSTIKAQETALENPANFTTNIHGIAQNMAGKKGVGICAVGLKSFFALTARYNEVLRTGSVYEQERLRSEVEIAGKKYRMLANAYGTNISNEAIAKVVSELSNQDQALVLSGLLSLATDNAKELALDKLNASNMLGMYIYGITIGVDFKTLADIICSETGLIINEMMRGNSFLNEKGMNVQNIFDYLETAPYLSTNVNLTTGSDIMLKLDQQALYDLTHSGLTVEQQYKELDKIKKEIDSTVLRENEEQLQEYRALHRLVEQAEDYVERFNSVDWKVYEDFKKLNEGADELRRLGQLLHINQGLENSYSKSINYLDTVTSVIADRQYSMFREQKRKTVQKALANGEKPKNFSPPDDRWKFDFHQFVYDENYKEAWIDIYDGKCNKERFENSQTYRNQFAQVFPQILKATSIDSAYDTVLRNLKPSRVFFNVLDVLQVPHFNAYLKSADMLHQAMMKTSVKYRAIFNLGKRAINNLGAFSTNDKEAIYRRTEQMVDRIIRDRYYLSKGLSIKLPSGTDYFTMQNNKLVKKVSRSTTAPIELGTEEGNASFKLFMETVVIPNLIKGKYGDGNNVDPALAKNEFIRSLSPTLYKHNPHYNVTINYAPGINMSPRSDAEKALFEKIKYDFNAFRSGALSHIKYKIGDRFWSIPELFYYYNQIAFGGRPGENTLTSIFQDILDYKPIKDYRDYENTLDMNGVIDVDNYILNKEVALRENPWASNMQNIYYEDSETGILAYWTKVGNIRDDGEGIRLINGYAPMLLKFDEDIKNYESTNADKITKKIQLSDKTTVSVEINKGKITKVTQGKEEIKIPEKAKPYFDNPPINVLIQPDGSKQLVYNTDIIRKYIEHIIKCS